MNLLLSPWCTVQELEELIGNLSSEQLEELQDIMERDHDEMTEFELISGELAQMGVEEEDIVDLKLLGSMMNDFVSKHASLQTSTDLTLPFQLIQVDDIEVRLEMKKPHDLMDHIQVEVE